MTGRVAFLLLSCYLKFVLSLSECSTVNRVSCRNVYAAQNCGLLTSCLKLWRDSVWIKQREDLSARCIFCMHNARVDENFTFLDRLCDSSSECSEAYRDFISTIQLTSAPKEDPVVVCNYLDICHSHTYLGNLNFGSPLCDDCKKIILDIQKLIADNATSDAVSRKLVNTVCSVLPKSVSDYCSDMVTHHVPAILRMIEIHISPEEICALLGLCPRPASLTLTISHFLPSTDSQNSGPIMLSSATHTKCNTTRRLSRTQRFGAEGDLPETSLCEQCKSVLQRTVRAVSDPVVRGKLKSDFDRSICSHLPLPMRQECMKISCEKIDEVAGNFSQVDPDSVCMMFRICPTSPTTHSLITSSAELQKTGSSLPGICQLCELVIGKLISIIIDKPTEENIAAALDQICNLLPSTYKSDCDVFIKNYGGKIVSAILEGTAPKLVCFSLNLCGPISSNHLSTLSTSLESPSSEVAPGTHMPCEDNTRFSWIRRPSPKGHPMWTSRNRLANQFVSFGDVPSCEQCEAVFKQVSQTLNDPEVQAQLKVLVDQRVCSQLPAFLRVACTTAVNEHFDDIIEALQQVDPKEICILGNMCPKASTNPPPGAQRQTVLSPGLPLPGVCSVCELVVDKVIDITWNNATEKSLASAMDQVCGLLPTSYTSKCYALVDTYGAEIIKVILQGVAPKAVCHLISLCGPNSIVAVATDLTKPDQPTIGLHGTTCEICKLLIKAIEYQLAQNDTETKLDELAKRMCQELPSSYVAECVSLVDKYLSTVIEYIEASMTPEQVCQQLNLCPPAKITIDSAICLRGPSFWYSSLEAAIMCNAVQFWQHLFPQKRLQSEVSEICRSQNLDYICSSTEMEHMCNKANECIRHRANQYFQLVSQHLQANDAMNSMNVGTSVIYNCSICEILVDRMRLHTKLFRRMILSKSFCSEFPDTNDKKQCHAVMNRKQQLYEALRYGTDKREICQNMWLCKPEMNASEENKVSALALACASGPLFACSSRRNAKACGMTELCNALKWFSDERDTVTPGPAPIVLDRFGQNACRWGAVYWCQSPENARRCGSDAVKHCETRVWPKPLKPETNGCSDGPSYWCRSLETARSCGPYAVNHCRRQLLLQPVTSN